MVRRLQALSGMLVALFVAAHLVNTWTAAAGPGPYAALQRWLSVVYQARVLEWLLLAAIVVHLGCAVVRWRADPVSGRRPWRADPVTPGWRPWRSDPAAPAPRPWRARLHRYSGVFLMVVIAGHVTAVRLLPGYFGIRPGFAGVAFSLDLLPGFFYPYYWLLGAAGGYHLLNGLVIAAGRLGWPLRLPARWVYAGAATAAVLTLVSLLAFGGVLFDVGDPWQSDFAHLYQRLMNG